MLLGLLHIHLNYHLILSLYNNTFACTCTIIVDVFQPKFVHSVISKLCWVSDHKTAKVRFHNLNSQS